MRIKAVIASICLSILISGCVLPNRVELKYDVNENLSGRITVRFIGCTSSADDPKEAREEMEDFKLDFESDTCESFFADMLGLRLPPEVSISGNDTMLDVSMSCEFESLIPVLSILESDKIRIMKDEDYLSFATGVESQCTDEEIPVQIILSYDGEITKHNGTSFDKKSNTITWDLAKGIQRVEFVLKLPKKDK